MKQANESRLRDLIVLRLSVRAKTAPSPSDVSRTLYPLLARRMSASEWRGAFQSSLEALRREGLVQAKGLVLTEAGQRRAQVVLCLKEPPRATSWRALKSKYLPRVFLRAHLPEGKTVSLAAAVLAEHFGFPVTADLTLEQVARRAVTKLADASSAKADVVTAALAARWLCEEDAAVPMAQPAATRSNASSATASTLQHVVEKVRRASAGAGVRQYGPEKVFIASVWEVLAGDAEIAALGEQGFKDVLAEAHRRGLVTLSRADLVTAMDPRDVAASEIRHHNATYHFIQRGASA
ncbi:MAG: hypothetical protein ABW217_10880 [Polyangiaceae bacterium]